METLLVFLAIAALQMAAAYAKQKKEAAKKATRLPPIPKTYREEPEFEFEPDPDPEPELELKPEFEPISKPAPAPIPVSVPIHIPIHATRRSLTPAAQGFIWAAILQEPRYKVKWKQR